MLLVLAGVNGAGKSSVGGGLLTLQGLTWFNPDTFARELAMAIGCPQDLANRAAWAEGVRRLDLAIDARRSYAFETTLGGHTITRKILAATRTHEVIIWFCGLRSPELHLSRVRARAARGGHDIPEAIIRTRWLSARQNLIGLMPHVAHLQVFDNSIEVGFGESVPDPVLVLQMRGGRLVWPARDDRAALGRTPDWARPLVEAALPATRPVRAAPPSRSARR
ncbi:MAG TPA: hypothetical protein VMM93_11795 [Vicinamibacterales bacterium]|nr:hypothetical protein [Vicinamibacterales bacterium]